MHTPPPHSAPSPPPLPPPLSVCVQITRMFFFLCMLHFKSVKIEVQETKVGVSKITAKENLHASARRVLQ